MQGMRMVTRIVAMTMIAEIVQNMMTISATHAITKIIHTAVTAVTAIVTAVIGKQKSSL